MDKNTTKDTTPSTDKTRASRTSISPRRTPVEPPPFDSPHAERAWHQAQAKADDAAAEAWSKFPPGSKLFVTTKGLPSRARAGVRFTNQGRTEVEVVNLSDDELAKVRAGDDTILGKREDGSPDPLAVRIRSANNAVTPLGAKAIVEDDGLISYSSADSATATDASADEIAALNDKIATLSAENAKLRAQLSSSGKASNDGRPERLKPTDKAPAGGDFGGGDDKTTK